MIDMVKKQEIESSAKGRCAKLVDMLIDSRESYAITRFLTILSKEPALKGISDEVHKAAQEMLASTLASSGSGRSPMSQDRDASQSNKTDNG